MGRVWTIEQRQKQAERIRSQKPWLKSTGPRTARGRLASSRNATRHGCYGAEFKLISVYLKMQKNYIDTLRFMLKHDLFVDETPFEISGNELNKNSIKSMQNDTYGCIKTTVKSGVLSLQSEYKLSLQPQSHKEHKESQSFLSIWACNDNSLISHHPNRHPRAGGDPESNSHHKHSHSKELCDSSCPLCLCGERPSSYITKNPPFLTGLSNILD